MKLQSLDQVFHCEVSWNDLEAELVDPVRPGNSRENTKQGAAHTSALVLVHDGDGHFGTAVLCGDVAPDTSYLAIDKCPPGNMRALIDMGEVLELATAEMGDALAESCETALDR